MIIQLNKLRAHSGNFVRIMSKKQKSQQAKKGNETKTPSPAPSIIPISQTSKGNILINILAKPGAKCNNVTDISPEGIGIQIAAPPVEGEANVELVRYIASLLGAKKSEISLERGNKSRQKTISVQRSDFTVEYVLEKFKTAIGE